MGINAVSGSDEIIRMGKYHVPDSDIITFSLISGDFRCGAVYDPDCEYVAHLWDEEGKKISNELHGSQSENDKGVIFYDCEVLCNNPWRLASTTGTPADQVAQNLVPATYTNSYTGTGACWNEDTQEYKPNCYEPISGLELYDLEAGGGKLLEKIDENVTVGDYLNSIFAFAIGVAGVLGVIMIVFYAYQYLTSASAGAKVELRNNILQVLLGIVLLLGIFTLLKTINPDLLILDPFVPEAASVPPGTPGTATVETGPGRQMVAIPGGTKDIIQSVSARTTENANNTIRISVSATLKAGATVPAQGLKLQVGTSATSLSRDLDMSLIGGTFMFLGEIAISTPEAGATWHYKIIDKASGEAVKLSATESENTTGSTQASCTGKTPNPETSQQQFRQWVQQCHNEPILVLQTQEGQPVNVEPCDDANIVTVSNVFGGKSFVTHKNIVPAIERISQKWEASGGESFYPINTIGGYHCRWLTGSTTVLSNHSYGLAVDINEAKNPYIPSISPTIQRSQYTDMPEAFVKLWTDEGFGWGGNWNTKKDAMHFSKIQNEGGNAIVDNI